MKRTILSLAILSCIGLAQAEYFIQFPVDVTFVKGDGQPSSPIDPETPTEPEIDCETQADQYPDECVEDIASWEQFALDKGFVYDSNWNTIDWSNRGLTTLPSELYPNSNPTSHISFNNNNLTNISSLSNLGTITGNLNLQNNQLSNIDGLIALTNAGASINIFNNNLSNVSGLINLQSIRYYLYMFNNQITDISGLSNIKVGSGIAIDSTYNGPKLPATSRFCSLNASYMFMSGYAQKSQVCEYTNMTWEEFAFNKSLAYGTNWNTIDWSNKVLTEIPESFYPNANPTSHIFLNNNQLQNVDGLYSLTTVGGNFNLHNNELSNIDGLKNLTTIGGSFNIFNNKLTNVDSLSNLQSIEYYLYIYQNSIIDITGLRNLKVTRGIRIDSTYSGPKLPASSRFCSLNAASIFTAGYAQKSQLCEI